MEKQQSAGPLSAAPHTLEGQDVLTAYEVDPKLGLDQDKVPGLQQKYGPNRLKPPPKPSLIKILLRNIANAMTMVLSEFHHLYFSSNSKVRRSKGATRIVDRLGSISYSH